MVTGQGTLVCCCVSILGPQVRASISTLEKVFKYQDLQVAHIVFPWEYVPGQYRKGEKGWIGRGRLGCQD